MHIAHTGITHVQSLSGSKSDIWRPLPPPGPSRRSAIGRLSDHVKTHYSSYGGEWIRYMTEHAESALRLHYLFIL
jgi:hypothetical protein